jgi:hypothetical protein
MPTDEEILETTVQNHNAREQNVREAARELQQNMGAVRVSFTWLGTQRKLSEAQTKQAADTFEAATELVTASKKLIDTKHPAYKAVTQIKSQVSGYWRSMTLPYPQDGIRLIRQSDVAVFEEKMQEFRTALQAAASNLQLEYETIKAGAREKLGRLYNADDYPASVENVFDIKWEYPAVEPPNYLMSFNPELYEQERQKIQQRFEDAVQLAENAFAEQLRDLISHLIERLTDNPDGTRKVFRTSAIENFKEFAENFRRMNVRSNFQLDQLIDQAENLVAGVDLEDLKKSRDVRQTLSTQMTGVQQALDNLITNTPRRRVLSMTD